MDEIISRSECSNSRLAGPGSIWQLLKWLILGNVQKKLFENSSNQFLAWSWVLNCKNFVPFGFDSGILDFEFGFDVRRVNVWNPNENIFGFWTLFLSEIGTLKNQMGQKVWISDRKKSVWNPNVCVQFRYFYLHISDNLMPSPYSVRLNVGVSEQTKNSLLQAI